MVAAYIEQHPGAAPTVKQHLAAIRMLFDWLVTGQVIPMNPASSVRGPKYVVKRGKTPVLKADQARTLLDSIETDSIVGLRDRAIIGLDVLHLRARSAAVVTCGSRTITRTASAGGFGCMKKAASGTKCRRTTTPRHTWTPISTPPASLRRRKRRSSGAWTSSASSRPIR